MSMYYVKEAANPNQWSAYTFVDNVNVPALDGSPEADLRFDTSGLLISGAGDVGATGQVIMSTFTPAVGAAPIAGMTFDYSNATQFGAGFAVSLLEQIMMSADVSISNTLHIIVTAGEWRRRAVGSTACRDSGWSDPFQTPVR